MRYEASKERYSKMKYRRGGESGLKLPVVSLGFWHNFGTNAPYDTMKELCFTAFDQGITHFDLANNYGPKPGSAEENLGRILKREMKGYRDELIISSKAGYEMWEGPYGDGGSKKYLIASADQSLLRMGLDYVDIFYHHRMDTETPLEETMEALNHIVKSGKALYAGISNYEGAAMKRASDILQEMGCPFIINQNKYSILDRTIEKNGLKEASAKEGKGIIAYSPLAQGLLTDRYLHGIPEDSRVKTDGRFLKETMVSEQKIAQIQKLHQMAENRGQTLAQMALSWVLKDDEVTSVLIGASKPEQIVQNSNIIYAEDFTQEELQQIDQIVELFGE